MIFLWEWARNLGGIAVLLLGLGGLALFIVIQIRDLIDQYPFAVAVKKAAFELRHDKPMPRLLTEFAEDILQLMAWEPCEGPAGMPSETCNPEGRYGACLACAAKYALEGMHIPLRERPEIYSTHSALPDQAA